MPKARSEYLLCFVVNHANPKIDCTGLEVVDELNCGADWTAIDVNNPLTAENSSCAGLPWLPADELNHNTGFTRYAVPNAGEFSAPDRDRFEVSWIRSFAVRIGFGIGNSESGGICRCGWSRGFLATTNGEHNEDKQWACKDGPLLQNGGNNVDAKIEILAKQTSQCDFRPFRGRSRFGSLKLLTPNQHFIWSKLPRSAVLQEAIWQGVHQRLHEIRTPGWLRPPQFVALSRACKVTHLIGFARKLPLGAALRVRHWGIRLCSSTGENKSAKDVRTGNSLLSTAVPTRENKSRAAMPEC